MLTLARACSSRQRLRTGAGVASQGEDSRDFPWSSFSERMLVCRGGEGAAKQTAFLSAGWISVTNLPTLSF